MGSMADRDAYTLQPIGVIRSELVDRADAPRQGNEGAPDADTVRRAFSLDPRCRWLDAEREWLFLPTGKNRAANYLRKMLAVSPSLSVAEVREGMRRYPSEERQVNLPRAVLLELCRCLHWVNVEGDQITAVVPQDYRVLLGNLLSQAVIDSHILGVPAALKDQVRGQYDLGAPNEHLGQLRTDGTNVWGLSRLLKRYAAEAGDALILEFDLNRGEVYAFVGGRDLLDSETRLEHRRADQAVRTARARSAVDPTEGINAPTPTPVTHEVNPVTLARQRDVMAESPPTEQPDSLPTPRANGGLPSEDSVSQADTSQTQAPPADDGDGRVVATNTLAREADGLVAGRHRPSQPSSLDNSDLRFGRALAQAMRTTGATFRELARATDLSAGYLNHLARGNRMAPAPDVVERIASALDIEPTYFFEYRLGIVREGLRQRARLVDQLYMDLGLDDPEMPSSLFSDEPFGEAVEVLANHAGVTYRELAASTGLSAGYLNHIVHGLRAVPEAKVCARIARALDVPSGFFFDYRLRSVVNTLEEQPDLVRSLWERLALDSGE
jgi:transcriptional regulator with XRE-family HTH domain